MRPSRGAVPLKAALQAQEGSMTEDNVVTFRKRPPAYVEPTHEDAVRWLFQAARELQQQPQPDIIPLLIEAPVQVPYEQGD